MNEKISAIDLAEILGVTRQYIYKSDREDWGPQDIRAHADDLVQAAKNDAKAIKLRLREYMRTRDAPEITAYKITEADKKRFMKKVAVAGDNDCWEWKAGKAAHGYGQFRFRHKQLGAHRFMYWLKHGEYPGEGYVCHTCDNPGCVNPNHLYLGDHLSNMEDRVGKGYDMSNRIKATSV